MYAGWGFNQIILYMNDNKSMEGKVGTGTLVLGKSSREDSEAMTSNADVNSALETWSYGETTNQQLFIRDIS